jgi:hypothetical protein
MTRQRRLFLAATAVALAVALAAAPRAAAGTYRAVQCHEPLGAGRADASFTRNAPRYAASADCHRDGLGITHEPGPDRTRRDGFGAWTLAAPAGASIVRAAARVAAAGADWHAPQAFVTLAGGTRRAIAGIRGDRHDVSWRGEGGRSLTARLRCTNTGGCGRGEGAHIHLRRVALMLRDAVDPALEPAGSLLANGSRRGAETLAATLRDSGSGARTVTVEVNDEPLSAQVFDCHLAGAVALRLRPCPTSETARFDLATTAPGFRQGPNRLRVCAADYAPRGRSNRTCESRRVRVDNLCPVSATDAGALRVRFGAGDRLRTRSDRASRIAGMLTDAGGAPVAGARVCVAARVRSGLAEERVLATPATDVRGRFRATLPAGPTRELRVAHWPDAERALERFATLQARAIPRLRLRPARRLENGERARFRVTLPGPANAGRRVAIQARSGGRWLRIAGGRTSATGAWRGAYRFRATTATRRYAFRATVTRQPGYPYLGGRSRIARIRVSGNRTAAKSKPGQDAG